MAKPGPDTVRYGGNTSCVQLVSDAGTLLIIDCGTGAHGLGHHLIGKAEGPVRGHILISHTHWDHIQGFPFFAPLFIPGNDWEVYAPHGFGQSLRETLAGQMQYTYFPVTLEALGAQIRYHDLTEGELWIDDVRIVTRYLNHPALTLGFRIEVDGATVVYACDHEPHDQDLAQGDRPFEGADQAHVAFLRNADLVIHDAQYTAAEFGAKVGWGHSSIEYAVAACRAAGARRLALTHHDPLRSDDAIDRLLAGIDATDIEVFGAAEGQVLELRGNPEHAPEETSAEPDATAPLAHPGGHGVLLLIPDSEATAPIESAIAADNLDLTRVTTPEDGLASYRDQRPDLVIVQGEPGMALAQSIRELDDDHAREVPIVAVIDRGEPPPDNEPVSDWIRAPFSTQYARTRIRTMLLRVACRWQRPPVPEDEPQRLAALQRLQILDTAPEERFDRITRLASALFDAPVALVTLVDADRQWFKSRVGAGQQESSREVSFCAHAIHQPEPLVVTDALNDDRFADNPMVSGGPRVRFYAGHPLATPDGYRVGTLCVVDTRPRQPTAQQLTLLADLAALVQRELAISGHHSA